MPIDSPVTISCMHNQCNYVATTLELRHCHHLALADGLPCTTTTSLDVNSANSVLLILLNPASPPSSGIQLNISQSVLLTQINPASYPASGTQFDISTGSDLMAYTRVYSMRTSTSSETFACLSVPLMSPLPRDRAEED
ncbi:hypothetical protein BDQ17DRAFT_1543903 [Cyathus striatus]|nr:hypothetical protein BDQ17DRAFT_1543903 [Cyathus striatus]